MSGWWIRWENRRRAGKIDETTTFAEGDIRKILPRYTEEARVANKALLEVLQQLAASRQATPAQIALAWVLAQKPCIVPIPGTTKRHRLTENNGAAAIPLSAGERTAIEAAAAHLKVVGSRYTEQMERSTGL
ncbi:MAG: aldo/keto reductase [Saprospiraceae bacterium]|nr:aldo/keto reductase [Saprospiraceae bacterium]